jgi:hypothetical protein
VPLESRNRRRHGPPVALSPGHGAHGNATAVARLVALSGRASPLAPGDLGTAVGTIDLAAIAAATDQHLNAGTDTQKGKSGFMLPLP